MISSTLARIDRILTLQLSIGICAIFIIVLIVLYFRSASESRRKVAALSQREEEHKVALALAAQNIARHDHEVLSAEISGRKRAEASLNHAAYHDRLTGIRNRSYLLHELRNSLEPRTSRSSLHRAILSIDIDGFKAVNDTMGQRFGDLLIREMSHRLVQCTRDVDTLARIGGDDFALLLNELSGVDQAWRIAQRILSVIEEPVVISDTRLSLTASVGLCTIEDRYVEAEDLLRDSDIAMYDAKRKGGARCVQYDESMRSEAFAIMKLKEQLRAAVTNNEFVLYYMPLVDMKERTLYGVEALIRWNHPVRGFLAPGEFIQVAEESDIIIAIGGWVLRQACLDFQEFQKIATRELLLSVNVSSRQLDQESFLTELSTVLKETGMRPEMLQLELLESVVIASAERMGALFSQIRSLGVKIAFDDFGTGYSSLSYLARYPIDTLKIDQSFVRTMKKGSVNADIVQLVIKLALTIGMGVCAEGVEDAQQAADLMAYGCKVGQGYLYGRPVSVEEITAVIKRGYVNR